MPPDVERQLAEWNALVNTVSEGSYSQILKYNLQSIVFRYFGLLYEMRLPKILGMFLLGFYAYRRGYFRDTESHEVFIRRVMWCGLVLGIIGNAALATLMSMGAFFPPSLLGIVATIAYAFGVPSLALFYTALIITLWQKAIWRRWLVYLAPVGRMALTNYLLQTVICVLIFYGYGFGLFGKVDATAVAMMALFIFSFQILFSTLWLKHFNHGPMEWVWRRLTYRQHLPVLPLGRVSHG